MLVNLGLMKIRLASTSDLFFLLSTPSTPPIRDRHDGFFRCNLNKFALPLFKGG